MASTLGRALLLESFADFHEIISNRPHKRLVVVEFFAQWSGPCSAMAEPFQVVSKDFPNVVFLRVDIDQQPELAAECAVTTVPCYQFYFQGDKVNEFSGASEAKLRDIIDGFVR